VGVAHHQPLGGGDGLVIDENEVGEAVTEHPLGEVEAAAGGQALDAGAVGAGDEAARAPGVVGGG
jgi:hypothetical protein